MKKISVFLFAVLMTVIFTGCANNDQDDNTYPNTNTNTENNTKEIDPLLAGDGYYWTELGRVADNYNGLYWYSTRNNNVYKFTNTTFYKGSYTGQNFIQETAITAYSKNGCIYSLDNDTLLLNYTVPAYPIYLDSDIQAHWDSGRQTWLANLYQTREAAENGKIALFVTPENVSTYFTLTVRN
jgi:hypothetical protein